jgi:polyhydroxybutyrate depolymerase
VTRRIAAAAALLFAAAVLALAGARALLASGAGLRSESKSISSQGRERTYRLYVPVTLPRDAAAPLVFVFHGGDGNGASAERLTGFDDLADREKFVVAYPDGWGKHWNDGRNVDAFDSFHDRVDDVAFVSQLIDAITAAHRIDSRRVYATGISNGAIFSNFLGARLAERIAAIAPVAGGLAEPVRPGFHPARPVSALIVNGTEDPLVPYDGGAVSRTHGRVTGAEETARLWAEADGCRRDAAPEAPTTADGGCRTRRSRWTAGREGSEVVLDTIEGGGHTWPGGPQYLPRLLIGRACPQPDATKEIWEFFRAHPREAAGASPKATAP